MFQDFVDLLKLEAGEKVLDVGCGIGGGDFYIAERAQAYVHGIDLSVNMVLLALERAQQQQHTLVRNCRPFRRDSSATLTEISTDKFDCLSIWCYSRPFKTSCAGEQDYQLRWQKRQLSFDA